MIPRSLPCVCLFIVLIIPTSNNLCDNSWSKKHRADTYTPTRCWIKSVSSQTDQRSLWDESVKKKLSSVSESQTWLTALEKSARNWREVKPKWRVHMTLSYILKADQRETHKHQHRVIWQQRPNN